MNDTDRIIGELKEFKRVTIEEIKALKEDVKALSQWRWRVAGGLTVVIALAELVNVVIKK